MKTNLPAALAPLRFTDLSGHPAWLLRGQIVGFGPTPASATTDDGGATIHTTGDRLQVKETPAEVALVIGGFEPDELRNRATVAEGKATEAFRLCAQAREIADGDVDTVPTAEHIASVIAWASAEERTAMCLIDLLCAVGGKP